MGLVGAGFVGPHHVDAVRRLGFVDIVAVAGSSEASGRQKAEALGARRGYGSYQALIDDPDVQVVHNATPNHLHYEVTSAALAKGQARRLGQAAGDDRRGVEAARRRGEARRRRRPPSRSTIAAIRSCSTRGTPSRAATSARRTSCTATTCRTGCSRTPTTRGGSIPEKGGASSALGDIGSHWCDLAQHVTGLRITHVLGDMTTSRPEAEEAARIARGVPGRRRRRGGRRGHHASRIWRRCWCGSTTAPRGRSRSARCAPATRTISCWRCAARRRRCAGARSTRTSCGWATATARNEVLQKDPSLHRRGRRGDTRTCPAATRKRGPTRSAT